MAGELTPEQKAARRNGLGGSDAPNVFGYGFGSQFSLWVDKVYGVDIAVTPAMRRGHDLEHVVAAKFEERTGIRVEPGYGQIWHPDIPWLFASIDYRGTGLLTATLVECKSAEYRFVRHQWGPDDSGPDGVPPGYLIQCRHQLAALPDMRRVFLPVLFVDTWELRVYEIERDEAFQDLMVEGEQRFWEDHVLARVPPPIGRPDRDLDAARQVPTDGTTRHLDATARRWLAQWADANRVTLEQKHRRDEAQAELARALGEAETGILDGTTAVTSSYNQHGTRTFKLQNKGKWD